MTNATSLANPVSLIDGRLGCRSTVQVEIRQPSAADSGSPGDEGGISAPCGACLDFISSDETIDRYDEIISASGWRLDTYRRNPVFQNAHQYGDIIFTLGRALETDVRSVAGRPVLFQRIQFATEVNPLARIAHGLYFGGFLHSVSVGFIPIRWEDGDGNEYPAGALTNDRVEDSKTRIKDCQPFRRRYLEQELLEVSAVAIPANPNALALALKSGAVEKSDLRDTLDLLRETLATPDAPITREESVSTHPPIHSPEYDLGPLLTLCREIKQLMKR